MIYLIGGSPRCGKTILAKRISLKERISYISTDPLRQMILDMVPKSEVKRKFPQTEMLYPKDKFRFEVYSPKVILKAQIVEAKTMWSPTKTLIQSLVNREQDFIIEGIHLFPRLVNQLKETRYWKKIKVVYLIKSQLDKIKTGFSQNKNEYDWLYPTIRDSKERLTKAAEMVKEKSDYIEKEAKKFRFKLYNTEDDFNKQIEKASKYLID